MHKLIFIILITLSLFSCDNNTEVGEILTYNITPDHNLKALIVSFNYSSDEKGEIILRYENDSWGEKDLFNCISEFKVVPEAKNIQFQPDSSIIKITADPKSKYNIQYMVKADYEGVILNHHRYRPIIQDKYYHLLGMRLFMTPDNLFTSDTTKVKIAYQLKNIPDDYSIHSSFGSEHKKEIFVSRNDLYPTIFIGGDFRRYLFEIEGSPVHFLTRGEWKHIKEEDLLNSLKRTIKSQRDFWNDYTDTIFTVTLIPTFEEWTETSKSYSVGGSGLTHSFSSLASNNPGVTLQKMRWLYNHELFHNWIGTKISNEKEEKEYWFSEGFTDYYAYKMMLINGEIDLEGYVDIYNKEIIKPHYDSPIKEIANSEITWNKYWADYNYQKLPYRRGMLYAFMLDTQIKNKHNNSKSLNNLMFDLFELYNKDQSFKFNATIFKNLLNKYLGSIAVDEFDQYIEKGQLINFKDKLPKGIKVKIIEGIPYFTTSKNIDLLEVSNFLKK